MAHLVIDVDLVLELGILAGVVQHLSRRVLQTPQGDHLGLQVARALVEGGQRTPCSAQVTIYRQPTLCSSARLHA